MYGGPTGFKGAERYQYPLELRGRPRDLGAAALKQGRQGARHAHRPDARLRAAAVRERVPEGRPLDRRAVREGDRDQDQVRRDHPCRRVPDEPPQRVDEERLFDLVTGAIEDTGDYAEARPAQAARRLRQQVQAELERPEVRLRRRPIRRSQPVHAVQRPHLLRSRSTTTRSRSSTASDLFDGSQGEGRVRGQVRPAVARSGDVGRAGEDRRSSSPGRTQHRCTATSRRKRPFWGIVNWNAALRLLGRPEQVLLQAGRVGQRQQRGRHPRVRRACSSSLEWSRAGRAREGLDRAVPGLRRRQRRHGRHVPERDEAHRRATRTSTRRLRQVPQDGRPCRAGW